MTYLIGIMFFFLIFPVVWMMNHLLVPSFSRTRCLMYFLLDLPMSTRSVYMSFLLMANYWSCTLKQQVTYKCKVIDQSCKRIYKLIFSEGEQGSFHPLITSPAHSFLASNFGEKPVTPPYRPFLKLLVISTLLETISFCCELQNFSDNWDHDERAWHVH